MWLFFGVIAMIAALLNIIYYANGREAKWFRFISLSFTALMLCAFYSADAKWVIARDWGALSDTVPATAKSLRICTAASIMINGLSLFEKPQK